MMIACWEISASHGQLKQIYPDFPASKGCFITLHTQMHTVDHPLHLFLHLNKMSHPYRPAGSTGRAGIMYVARLKIEFNTF